jgi:excisionase family DNA binding protein
MRTPDDRRVITAREAAESLGIPAGTVRSWASRGDLFAVSIGRDGQRWYLLSDVMNLGFGASLTA